MKRNSLLPNLIRLCIDGYQDGSAYGKVYFTTRKEAITFQDLAQMVIAVDNILDVQGYPQSFQDKRTFFKEKTKDSTYTYKPEIIINHDEWYNHLGTCQTYNILIESRYHTSWQGTLYDKDNYIIKSFDNIFSILNELI